MIKRIVFLVNFHILLINVLAAQLNVVATGGDAQANSGAISYSVGQIDYTSVTMQSGSVAQGLQHPFQATIVTDVKLFDGLSFARIYPNPFSTSFSMNIESEIVNGLNYQVLDVFGRVRYMTHDWKIRRWDGANRDSRRKVGSRLLSFL